MSDRTPDRMPDRESMLDKMQDRMSARMSESMSDRMPDRMSARMSDRMSGQYLSGRESLEVFVLVSTPLIILVKTMVAVTKPLTSLGVVF